MQLHSARTSPPMPPPKVAIPYSTEALRQDLERLRGIWEDCQASRDRNAIYPYLTAVCGLVTWWTAEDRAVNRAHPALRLQRLKVSDPKDPFASIIRCTADPAKADKRTRSKWSRVMRYATAYKPNAGPWTGSSVARAASTRAPLGSPGAWVERLRSEPQDREWARWRCPPWRLLAQEE